GRDVALGRTAAQAVDLLDVDALHDAIGALVRARCIRTRRRDRRARGAGDGPHRTRLPPEGFAEAADEVWQQIRRTAPRARAMLKETMNRSLPAPEARIFQRAIDSPEPAEGLSAFLEKRAPRWRRGST